MKNTRIVLMASITFTASLMPGAAHAALEGRDLNGSAGSFEAYYDTDLNITWLANANVNGLQSWQVATAWAANLSIVDTVNNITYDNWRLPATLQPDASCDGQSGGISSGYGCTGSEMGHLFYAELGGVAAQSVLGSSNPDVAKFTNLLANRYWSVAEFEPYVGGELLFNFGNGHQGAYDRNANFYALAISPGDVGAVPEASTWAMLLAGLGMVGVAARRRRS